MLQRRSSSRSRRFRCRLAAVLLVLGPACGQKKDFHHSVFPASGTILHKGRPATGSVVGFHPVDPKTVAVPEGRQGPEIGAPIAHVGDEGRFNLSTYTADDGIPAGDYKVTVVWYAPAGPRREDGPDPNDPGQDDLSLGPNAPRTIDRLRGKYRDPMTSPLKATVTRDGPNDFRFELD